MPAFEHPIRTLRAVLTALAVFSVLLPTTTHAAQPGPDDPEVVVSAEIRHSSVAPGDESAIAVIFDHAEGFHTYPPEPMKQGPKELIEPLLGLSVQVTDAGGLETESALFPEPHRIDVPPALGGEPGQTYTVYEDRAIVYVPITIPDDAEVGSTVTLELRASHQACNDQFCLAPFDTELSVNVAIGETTEPDPEVAELFEGYEERAASGTAAVSTGGGEIEGASTGIAGLIVLAILAFAGGLVLNMTPCVLPVIPIKVMTITQHGGSKGKTLFLGVMMAAGVVAFWVGIGLPVAILAGAWDPTQLFSIWWVTMGIGLIIAAMSVGIMGAFNINLPKQVYMVNPKADTPQGSFVFGIMTAILGLPCFGFVAGALLAGAASMPWWQIMTIFAGLGVGMASPYLVLAAFPKLLDAMPRTGPASELVKQVMGLLMLAAAAYFIGSGALGLAADLNNGEPLAWWGKTIHWWFIALFALAAGGWLAYRTVRITTSTPHRAAFAALGLIFAAGGVGAATSTTMKLYTDYWVPYTEEAMAAALESDKVVVLDFTAEWCLNCKALEATVLNTKEVGGMLRGDTVVPIKADLTSRKADGWDKLKELGRTGIPLLAVFGPGLEEPWLSSAYTSGQVLDAIERARGEGAPAETVTRARADSDR